MKEEQEGESAIFGTSWFRQFTGVTVGVLDVKSLMVKVRSIESVLLIESTDSVIGTSTQTTSEFLQLYTPMPPQPVMIFRSHLLN